MFFLSCIISAFLSGMGVGGGSIFILLTTLFNIIDHKEAMIYNLIMFIAVGISATISNIKNNNFDKKIFFKLVIFSSSFAILGTYISKKVSEDNLRLYFNIFIIVLGVYEIISSLMSLKKAKNSNG